MRRLNGDLADQYPIPTAKDAGIRFCLSLLNDYRKCQIHLQDVYWETYETLIRIYIISKDEVKHEKTVI